MGLGKMRKGIKIIISLCLLVILLFNPQSNYAGGGKKAKFVVKKITGEVGFVNDNFISVVYRKEEDRGKEYEIMLYIDKGVMLEDITDNDLTNLDTEDIVKVEYIEVDEEGKSKRIARKVRFIRKKAPIINLKGFKK
jgi:hypothetical protein